MDLERGTQIRLWEIKILVLVLTNTQSTYSGTLVLDPYIIKVHPYAVNTFVVFFQFSNKKVTPPPK